MILLFLLLAADEWEKLEEKDGVTLEIRAVTGKKFDEIRVSMHTALPVLKLCDAIWGTGTFDSEEPGLKARKLLEDKGSERVVYDQIATPIVSDRDYTVRSRRLEDKGTGVCQVFFESRNELGPPVTKEYVRIPIVYGSWTFEPASGGTDITYFIYSDPGGSIPPFMAKGAQRSAAKKWMKMALDKAAR
jgi:hypothetical protein